MDILIKSFLNALNALYGLIWSSRQPWLIKNLESRGLISNSNDPLLIGDPSFSNFNFWVQQVFRRYFIKIFWLTSFLNSCILKKKKPFKTYNNIIQILTAYTGVIFHPWPSTSNESTFFSIPRIKEQSKFVFVFVFFSPDSFFLVCSEP